MASESEQCVDKLIKVANDLDELSSKLNLVKSEDLLALSKTRLEEAQMFIENNKPLIPSFTLKRATDSLNRLRKQVESIKWAGVSFKFSGIKSAASDEKKSIEIEEPARAPTGVIKPSTDQEFFGFRDLSGQSLSLDSDEIDSKDIKLVNLSNCSIRIVGFSNTVYMSNVKDSEVVVCLACRAITIAASQNCNFKLVCQQLRIDSNTNCSYSIYTSARSMLESSKGLTFKVLKLGEFADNQGLDYEKIKGYLTRANFSETKNNWKCIDDFDWLSPDSPSINYSICE